MATNAEDDNLIALNSSSHPNQIYTFQRPRQQQCSVLYPIIKYLFTNLSSHRAWQKLIKTCKYFYSKTHVYPIQFIKNMEDGKWNFDGEIVDISKSMIKLWLCDTMKTLHYNNLRDVLSLLIPKIFKCEFRHLELRNHTLTWNEYQFLTSSGTIKTFHYWSNMTVKYPDDTVVTCDKLIENLKNARSIEINCSNNPSMFQSGTVKNIIQFFSKNKNMVQFNLTLLPENFVFSSFSDFLLRNETVKEIHLSYSGHLPDVYKKILEDFIDRIIADPCKIIPYIWFPGFNDNRLQKFHDLLHQTYLTL